MKAPIVRKPWQRVRHQTRIMGESLVDGSHVDECDINEIIKKYDNTGLLPGGREGGQFTDVTQFQRKSRAQLIMESRETLDTVGKDVEKAEKAAQEAEERRIADLETRNAELEKRLQEPPEDGES